MNSPILTSPQEPKPMIQKHQLKDYKLSRVIIIKIFVPGNREHKTFRLQAKPGTAFGEDEVQKHLESLAERVERQWPTEEYRLVQLGLGRFNFVWDRTKEPAL